MAVFIIGAFLFIAVPCFIASFIGVSIYTMLEQILKFLPVLIVIFIALVIYGKKLKKKERVGASREATLLLNLLETDSRLVMKEEDVLKVTHQYAQKLGIPTDEASLTAAFRKGFADITAVQDAAFKAEFPDDPIADYVYYHKEDNAYYAAHSGHIDLMKNTLKQKLYSKKPSIGSCWIREELPKRANASGVYMKEIIYTYQVVLKKVTNGNLTATVICAHTNMDKAQALQALEGLPYIFSMNSSTESYQFASALMKAGCTTETKSVVTSEIA